jgi:hypothetical protein
VRARVGAATVDPALWAALGDAAGSRNPGRGTIAGGTTDWPGCGGRAGCTADRGCEEKDSDRHRRHGAVRAEAGYEGSSLD